MAKYIKCLLILHIALLAWQPAFSQDLEKIQNRALTRLEAWENPLKAYSHIAKPKIDSVEIRPGRDSMVLFFAPALSYYPFREDDCYEFINSVKKSLGRKFRKFNVEVRTNGFNLYELVPNIYRTSLAVDSSRIISTPGGRSIFIRPLASPAFGKGLDGRNIAVWHSHGYYYEMNLDRWEWQRAKLFGTVEDISVMGYVQPYLVRMLENSGATVLLPRERDTQSNEVIVDNDGSSGRSYINIEGEKLVAGPGFRITDTLFASMNPFKNGTSLTVKGGPVTFVPDIPERGDYAVYVSYPTSSVSDSVTYTVNHTGGQTSFVVNQRMGGGTWIYLGTFRFGAGTNPGRGSVTAYASPSGAGVVGVDAVRFGGGMGSVARRPSSEIAGNQRSVSSETTPGPGSEVAGSDAFRWKVSGKPRYMEASRYYLQYAGMPDSLVYSPTFGKNDYNDDYQSRGLWVNYLSTGIAGQKPAARSLGIPLDLSVAFHTDAGITPNDSIIGSLAIYSTATDNGKFPGGKSRMASRDLSDIIQTQVVNDIRSVYNPGWTRRGLWDRPYSEARRPDVPAILLELLSHQNKADQEFGLDPRFRFSVGRAVYKGILKYLAYSNNTDYCVQPLPPSGFAITPAGDRKVRLSWKPVSDTLEPSAAPTRYRISMRINDNGFDNGFFTAEESALIELESYDTIYSFRVTGINEGGESFPSEILSAGFVRNDKSAVVVVNAFDRICGPEWFDRDGMAGVAWWSDRGVADGFDLNAVGDQYDFDRKSPWLDDDEPGWGASWSDKEGKLIHGNTFDFTYIHGKALVGSGRSFFSVSDEFFESGKLNPDDFDIADIILGEEKATPWFGDSTRMDFRIYTEAFMREIDELTEKGKNFFMSGAYIGSDLLATGDSAAIKFAARTLHTKYRTGHAVKTGRVYSTDYAMDHFKGKFTFNTGTDPSFYSVEAPDAIEPSDKKAVCALRYEENNTSAGVLYNGKYKTFVLGFPFETITGDDERNRFMNQVVKFLAK